MSNAGVDVQGRLDIVGPTGRAALTGAADSHLRLSIENVSTAWKFRSLHAQAKRVLKLMPRDRLPSMDVEIAGWRIARLTNGRLRPVWPASRPMP